MKASCRVAVVGAGLAGRLCAYRLSGAGHQVSVFDRSASAAPALGEPRAAAWTSAGMLSPIAEMESGGAEVRDLGRRSLELWKAIESDLNTQHQSLDLHLNDSLMICHAQDTGAADRVLRLLKGESGQVEKLEAGDIRPLAPGLKGTLHAWRLIGEGICIPPPPWAHSTQAASMSIGAGALQSVRCNPTRSPWMARLSLLIG